MTVIPPADGRMSHEACAHDRSPKTPPSCGPLAATTDAATTQQQQGRLNAPGSHLAQPQPRQRSPHARSQGAALGLQSPCPTGGAPPSGYARLAANEQAINHGFGAPRAASHGRRLQSPCCSRAVAETDCWTTDLRAKVRTERGPLLMNRAGTGNRYWCRVSDSHPRGGCPRHTPHPARSSLRRPRYRLALRHLGTPR